MSRYPLRNRHNNPPELKDAIRQLDWLKEEAHALDREMAENQVNITQAWFRSTPDHPAFLLPVQAVSLLIAWSICCYKLERWVEPILDEWCADPVYAASVVCVSGQVGQVDQAGLIDHVGNVYLFAVAVALVLVLIPMLIFATYSGKSRPQRSLKQQVKDIIQWADRQEPPKSRGKAIKWLDEVLLCNRDELDPIRDDYKDLCRGPQLFF